MNESKRDLIIAVVAILILANVLLFSGILSGKTVKCYMDHCLVSTEDPIEGINELISSSSRAIILMEGDVEATQTTGLIDLSYGALVGDFTILYGAFYVDYYGIEIDNGQSVGCLNFTLEFCQNLRPQDNDTLMIKLKYPVYGKNEIELYPEERIIEFRAKTGSDLYAMVTEIFEKLFLKK